MRLDAYTWLTLGTETLSACNWHMQCGATGGEDCRRESEVLLLLLLMVVVVNSTATVVVCKGKRRQTTVSLSVCEQLGVILGRQWG